MLVFRAKNSGYFIASGVTEHPGSMHSALGGSLASYTEIGQGIVIPMITADWLHSLVLEKKYI